MACYSPWVQGAVAELWQRPIACGKCLGCLKERARQWAIRCMHEAQLHDRNCFVTLTYSPECLPPGGSLRYRDFQLFMKRLRRSVAKVRFFMGAEYGDRDRRPHFHACLFGWDFPDKWLWKTTGQVRLYRSELLERLWPFGFSTVGAVTWQSAAYVARYCTKKVEGRELGELVPEFGRMSLRPGIGEGWVRRFASDVDVDGKIVVDGREQVAPRYYRRWLKERDLQRHFRMLARAKRGELAEQLPGRLVARETVARAAVGLKRRKL